jgi:glycine/D-amino acid oxidase-like deaminating enzyme
VLLAPLTGELVGALVAGTDPPDAELAALSPARFERMEARR